LVIDRSYIHGFPTQEVQRGVAVNSADTDILNSYISDVHGKGYDTQAICGWNGPGPFKIINNHLEAAGENVMFGGAPAAIPNLVPSDIIVKNNYFFKPLSWYVNDPSYAGIHWTVKNIFELKNARRVVVEGNIFENNWTDAQAGRSIVFTPRPSDSGAWAVVEDVVFQNNIVRNVGSGVSLLGIDDPPMPQEVRLHRVRIANNIFEIDGPRFGSNGAFATVINGTDEVTIEHNTVFQTGSMVIADYAPNTRFIFRDNISRHNEYGIFGSGRGIGNDAINYYFPNSVVSTNVIAKEVNAPWNVELIYPAGNYAPLNLDAVNFVDFKSGNYRLASFSPYKGAGTGGTDPGCNIDVLTAALNGTSSPLPTPTPTPSPTATPTPTPTPTPAPTPAVLSVSISSPKTNSTFSLDTSVTVTGSVSNVGCAVTSVEFYAGSQLIGTATVQPYSTVWSNMVAGTYSVTAKAQDNCSHTATSSSVTVKISKALKSVRSNRKNTTQLSSAGTFSLTSQTASPLNSIVAGLEQTYNDFAAERSLFNSADQIERYLFAALFLARSGDALAKETKSTNGVVDRLNKIDAYLSFCEDLMTSDKISQQSLTSGNQVNARANLLITQTSAAPLSTTGFMVSPDAGAKVLTASTSPFGTQTVSASSGTPQYELGDLTVTVNGRAAALLMVSPTQINFTVPSGTTGGLADILVTSREGYITHGTAAVTGLNPTIFGQTGDASGLGTILNAVGFQSGIFSVSGTSVFRPDPRTRLTILTSGISTGAANTNSANDVLLGNGKTIANLAESVAVEARTSDDKVYMLAVEFAGAQGTLAGLDQVNVALASELRGAGSVQLTLVVNGVRSNTMRVMLQ
jgi:uncharacterized protein (TIGR03437 family)